jgi:hypothetical protein
MKNQRNIFDKEIESKIVFLGSVFRDAEFKQDDGEIFDRIL